ncbi:MAG: hypothetical protein LBR11_03305 [Deltaproteobacteria bacterium]|jgi:hypothetical protein|nr:hypothetical protein [Deltaproteobacteria bacterium]
MSGPVGGANPSVSGEETILLLTLSAYRSESLAQSEDKKKLDNNGGLAWKWVVSMLMEEFFGFFLPDVAKLIDDPDEDNPVAVDFDKSPPPRGASSSRGARHPDITFKIPLNKEKQPFPRFFFEQRREKDASLGARRFATYARLLVKFPGDRIDGFVLSTGYENEDDFLSYNVREVGAVNDFKILTASLRRFSLDELESDNRPFARFRRAFGPFLFSRGNPWL